MNKTIFTAKQILILRDESLTAEQAGRLLFMAPATVRYHRGKIGVRVASRRSYGIVKRLLTELGAAAFDMPVKQLAYMYGCSSDTIKKLRRCVRKNGATQ